jgi:DNA mismatch endonuclease (patch repair protein)
MDVFTSQKRREVMGKIRAKNTTPELAVRRFLFKHGFRFQLHRADLPGKPDIVLPKYETIFLVHGCFWHRHTNCRLYRLPRSNRSYWRLKAQRNIRRDRHTLKALRRLGWRVITVWECQLRASRRERVMRAGISKMLRH